MPPTLELRLLGSTQIAVDGVVRALRKCLSRKPLHLIKILALQPRRQLHREEIQEILWPNADESAGRRSFDKTLYLARRGLEPSLNVGSRSAFLHLHEERLTLGPDHQVRIDVDEFERLAREGLALKDRDLLEAARLSYGGNLLVEDPYEEWALSRRTALRLLMRDVVFRLAETYREHGQPMLAVEMLRDHVAAEPWDEDAHRIIIQAYLDLGYTTQAERQLAYCRASMVAGLDAEPSASTEALLPLKGGSRLLNQSSVGSRSLLQPTGPPDSGVRMPSPATIVGRRWEIGEIGKLLGSHRLVTLTGIGGIGKSTIARRIAGDLKAKGLGETVIVDLASVVRSREVALAVARAFDIDLRDNADVAHTIASQLEQRPYVLVLDNCEQVASACARLVDFLYCANPMARFLVASRIVLDLAVEKPFAIGPLDVPPTDPDPNLLVSAEFDAVRLFVLRTRANSPVFDLTERNIREVIEICTLLEGIPLAIELAAATVRSSSVRRALAGLKSQMDGCLQSNAGSMRRTVLTALAWSYNRLSETERRVFRRLSVFQSGWTQEAAEFVCSACDVPKHAVASLIAQLEGKSVVSVQSQNGSPRRYLLETVRRFARQKLAESGEEGGCLDRHSRFFLEAAPRGASDFDMRWMVYVDREYPNIQAALKHLSSKRESSEFARLCLALTPHWRFRGRIREGFEWLESATKRAEKVDSSLLAGVLRHAAEFLARLGQFEEAENRSTTSKRLSTELHDNQGATKALLVLASIEIRKFELRRAERVLFDALALARTAGSPLELAKTFNDLGRVAYSRGELDRARSFFLKSHALLDSGQSRRAAALAQANLGVVCQSQGDYRRAEAVYAASLAVFREIGDSYNSSLAMVHIAGSQFAQLSIGRARATLEAARDVSRLLDDPLANIFVELQCGDIALYERKLDEAAGHFSRVASIAKTHGLVESEISANLGLAQVAVESQEFETASRLANEAVLFYSKREDREELARSLSVLAAAVRPTSLEQSNEYVCSAASIRAKAGFVLPLPARYWLFRHLGRIATRKTASFKTKYGQRQPTPTQDCPRPVAFKAKVP